MRHAVVACCATVCIAYISLTNADLTAQTRRDSVPLSMTYLDGGAEINSFPFSASELSLRLVTASGDYAIDLFQGARPESLWRGTLPHRKCCELEAVSSQVRGSAVVAPLTSIDGLGARLTRAKLAELYISAFIRRQARRPPCIAFDASSVQHSTVFRWQSQGGAVYCHQTHMLPGAPGIHVTANRTVREWLTAVDMRCYHLVRMREWLGTWSSCNPQHALPTDQAEVLRCAPNEVDAWGLLLGACSPSPSVRPPPRKPCDAAPDCANITGTYQTELSRSKLAFTKWRAQAKVDGACGYAAGDAASLDVAIQIRLGDVGLARLRVRMPQIIDFVRELMRASEVKLRVHIHCVTKQSRPTPKAGSNFSTFDEFGDFARFRQTAGSNNTFYADVEDLGVWHFVLNTGPTFAIDCLSAADILVVSSVTSFVDIALVRSSGLFFWLVASCPDVGFVNYSHTFLPQLHLVLPAFFGNAAAECLGNKEMAPPETRGPYGALFMLNAALFPRQTHVAFLDKSERWHFDVPRFLEASRSVTPVPERSAKQ